jgi:hypothetical protein
MVGNVEAIWIDYIIFMSLGTISCAGNLSEKPRPVSSAIKIFCRWEHVFCRWEPVFRKKQTRTDNQKSMDMAISQNHVLL